MADGIELDGFLELEDLFKDLEITDTEEKRALNAAGNIFVESVKSEVPKQTGGIEKSVKKKIKRIENGDLGIEIKLDKFYSMFVEFGTSQQKHNVGFFDKAIRNKELEAIQKVKEIILK